MNPHNLPPLQNFALAALAVFLAFPICAGCYVLACWIACKAWPSERAVIRASMHGPYGWRAWIAAWIVASTLLLGLAARGEESDKVRTVRARVTYYEPRSCPYGNVTSTGRFATEGVTVAVDPRVIPYGSRVRIPALDGLVGDGWFLAQDTGSAVKSRKASRHWGSRAPVVDVYVASARKLRQVEKAVPMFCQVEVHR